MKRLEKSRKRFDAAVLLAVALCANATSAETMRFLSFNIWGDYFKNPVAEREAAIESTIRQYAPDIVSLQEVTPNWWKSPMFANLSADYGIVRGNEEEAMRRAGAKGPMKPRWVNHEPLLYKKARLSLLDSGVDFFHISMGAEKSVTWAVLEDRTDKRRFFSFATHFWYKGNGAESDAIREYNALQILWRLSELRHKWGDLPVIGGGDLNSKPGALSYNVFLRNGFVNAADAADVRSPHCSHHGNPVRGADGKYHGKLHKPDYDSPTNSIDHVFYTAANIRGLKHEIGTDQMALDATDHSPVLVEFELNGK